MSDQKHYRCGCGRNRPYRRAFECHECWQSRSAPDRAFICSIGRSQGKGTLRAGQIVGDRQPRRQS